MFDLSFIFEVEKIFQIVDEGRIFQVVALSEKIQIFRIGQRLNKFQIEQKPSMIVIDYCLKRIVVHSSTNSILRRREGFFVRSFVRSSRRSLFSLFFLFAPAAIKRS